MRILDRISQILNRILVSVAGCFMVAMILLACLNIFLRLAWVPVSGTFELMGYFCAIVTAFALGYTQMKRGHIAVDILVQRFSKKTQRLLNSINSLICMIFFTIVAGQIIQYGITLWETGEVTETLRIIYYPFTFGVALGCVSLSVVFLSDFLHSVLPVTKGEK
ncbi:MAG: TRAP transporter small permease [Deltaproteobacteria bacterium]|nr:TRAP transporter small permease [Deltaproteobacteria bacterium]